MCVLTMMYPKYTQTTDIKLANKNGADKENVATTPPITGPII
jgi:hypothetical protein